eukprot:SM000184S03789  [mRNA]  locus=s184:215774:217508:- [translate_table: standard]
MSSPSCYMFAADSDIKALATCCQRLTELRLSCAQSTTVKFTNRGLQSLARLLPKLRTLHVFGYWFITDSGIQQLATGCSLLQDVSISACHKISVESVHAIGRGCHELRRLRCELSEAQRSSWLENGSLHLSHLEMLHLRIPSNRGEGAITTMATLASSCPRLHELWLEATWEVARPSEECPSILPLATLTLRKFHINGASFRNLLASCPALKTLRLQGCKLVVGMGELPAKLSLCSLECHHLTGQVRHFWDLGSWCPNLTSLHTSCSPLVSQAEKKKASELEFGFWPLQTRRPLQALSILTCQSVLEDDSITLGMAKASPHLQELRLSCCEDIDAEAIHGFLSSCPRLKLIRVQDKDSFASTILEGMIDRPFLCGGSEVEKFLDFHGDKATSDYADRDYARSLPAPRVDGSL